ncbi:KdsC family phosphatase [Desulfobaculum bizertense]|uniref:3-deoxy-D-manno-octulosonate 8-phosphate phosphatase KdsC n=1 Tax=Desulfobaculum bizertense DSM 18034 TaxID=1121442 RepID=A0A1T4W431_9BACT|nr:HAD hydrolase family protein [Desulfobaculum bizertense]UIJ38753.1 HAD hydrolase family protein [Desulfobaculum bizertense]SKA71899.1 3-deoxy-D-manno-octulosonate 8-phosphate phosphatase (KDO 8-P phosphatase) [Desulfobaculum bizertense DSM 18034]
MNVSMTEARERAKKIRLVVLDVDGCLTDCGLYFDADGRVIKRFNAQDGLGIKLAQSVGIRIAVITGLKSGAVDARMKQLGIEDYHSGHVQKIPLLKSICEKHGLDMSEVAYVGDDWIDAGPMRQVGLPIAVNNAQPEICELASLVLSRPGGQGAVREALRFILDAQGRLEELWDTWSTK